MRNDELEYGDRAETWRSPWTGGCRLISLWDMKEYLARNLVDASACFSTAYSSFLYAEDKDLTEERRKSCAGMMVKFYEALKLLGLPLTTKAAGRFVFATKKDNSEELEKKFDEVLSRFQDEAENLPLFYVHQDALRYYNQTNLFGDEFKTKFPSANIEIIEAGNCFAFDRFTSCVFHLMRAMEIALRVLFVSLGLPPRIWSTSKWSQISNRIDGKIEKNNRTLASDPSWQRDRMFYESASAFIAAVRAPMRNATMHVESVYDEPGAENVFGAVKSFMRHIATKLKETP